ASGGTLAPGNSIGTLNVANITINAGSTYTVELNDGGFVAGTNSDLLNATGTATINGGNVHVTPVNGTDDGSTYTVGGVYTIITAGTAVTGTFDTLTDDYAFLNFALGYDANNVFLTSSL
ncbi:autotransporter outer membrane beta-barrel domain-containing protein, partial [Phyllobacterium phragmitis]